MNFIETAILSIVEGLTEFLPISSTGHMILVSALLKPENQEFLKTFEISIQLGAILAIVLLYAKNFIKDTTLYKKILVAFLPTAIIGFFFYKIIKAYFFNPILVSITLIIGGIILILIDKIISRQEGKYTTLKDLSYQNAFFIGLIQSISIIPGVSRSAATIIGGVLNGFNKKQAAEFSFLLAIPTMFAATGYDLLKVSSHLSGQEYLFIVIGSLISFVSAWLAVKFFLRFIEKHGFTFFGYYRIILGLLFLWYLK